VPRIPHGAIVTTERIREADTGLAGGAAVGVAPAAAVSNFGFLFEDLQRDPASLLPREAATNKRLAALGRAMLDPEDPRDAGDPGDTNIPAIYTYFGQFVDHDITLEEGSPAVTRLLAPGAQPLSIETIRRDLKNRRRPTLDLDSLYGTPVPPDQLAPRDGEGMRIGKVTRADRFLPRVKPVLRVRLTGDDNDLPRQKRHEIPELDRAAIIGDGRNDENLIISQLHLAFLKAHNAWVKQGKTFDQARRLLRQHYQHIVIHDFLERIADPAIVREIRDHGNRLFGPDQSFMPLEFSVAAYRFGHSLVRENYEFNLNFTSSKDDTTVAAGLEALFTFTALSGDLGKLDTLPDNWIIEWHRFVDTPYTRAANKTRRIDTKLAATLFSLPDIQGGTLIEGSEEELDEGRLPVRNLLRGYILRLPTGQAVAKALDLPVLTDRQIEEAAASPAQVTALRQGGFLRRTPLWYYVLAEARHPSGGNGQRLGPVGSTIVAEVLIGLARRSEDSILNTPGWRPSLPAAQAGKFQLADLLRFAAVLPVTYKVQSGDSLSKIAKSQLQSEGRWPEILVLNRDQVPNRDKIKEGQILLLPGGTPKEAKPVLHTVKTGDTLFDLAKKHLGDNRRRKEIYELNKEIIGPDPGRIRPGQLLVIARP
jgi:nucleoid-associated protein YgaU